MATNVSEKDKTLNENHRMVQEEVAESKPRGMLLPDA